MPIPYLNASSSSMVVARRTGVSAGFSVLKQVAAGARGHHVPLLLSSMDLLRFGPDHNLAMETVPLGCYPTIAELIVNGTPDIAGKSETKLAGVWAELAVNWGRTFDGPQDARHNLLEKVRDGLPTSQPMLESVVGSFNAWLQRRAIQKDGVFEATAALKKEAADMGVERWDFSFFQNGDEVKAFMTGTGTMTEVELKLKAIGEVSAAITSVRPILTIAMMKLVSKPQEVFNTWMGAFFACITCFTKGLSFTEQWLESRVASFCDQHVGFRTMRVPYNAMKVFCTSYSTTGMGVIAQIGVLHGMHHLARNAQVPVFSWIIEQARLSKVTGLVAVAKMISRLDYCPLDALLDWLPGAQTEALVGGLIDCLTNPWGSLLRPSVAISSMPDWVYLAKEVCVKVFKEDNLAKWQNNISTMRSKQELDKRVSAIAELQGSLQQDLQTPLEIICSKFKVRVVRGRGNGVTFEAHQAEEEAGGLAGDEAINLKSFLEAMREHGAATLEGNRVLVPAATLARYVQTTESDRAKALRALCDAVTGLSIQEELGEIPHFIDHRHLCKPIHRRHHDEIRAVGIKAGQKLDVHIAAGDGEMHDQLPQLEIYRPKCHKDIAHDGCGRDWFPQPKEKAEGPSDGPTFDDHVAVQDFEDLVHMAAVMARHVDPDRKDFRSLYLRIAESPVCPNELRFGVDDFHRFIKSLGTTAPTMSDILTALKRPKPDASPSEHGDEDEDESDDQDEEEEDQPKEEDGGFGRAEELEKEMRRQAEEEAREQEERILEAAWDMDVSEETKDAYGFHPDHDFQQFIEATKNMIDLEIKSHASYPKWVDFWSKVTDYSVGGFNAMSPRIIALCLSLKAEGAAIRVDPNSLFAPRPLRSRNKVAGYKPTDTLRAAAKEMLEKNPSWKPRE